VGETSEAETVRLTNIGKARVRLAGIAVSAGFSIAESTCRRGLAARRSCVVKVVFKPEAEQAMSGTLSFIPADSGSPQSVSLAGLGRIEESDQDGRP